jgi:hypothetical protein
MGLVIWFLENAFGGFLPCGIPWFGWVSLFCFLIFSSVLEVLWPVMFFFLSFLIFRAFLSLFMVYVILAFRYSELYLFCDDGCIFMCHGV